MPGCRCTSVNSNRPATPAEVERALSRGVDWLLERQDSDGAWRSATYGAFKDGDALTPLVLRSAPNQKGAAFLAAFDPADAKFPTYAAALAVEVLPEPGAWRELLIDRQLDEHLGWSTADKEYGGWGYSITRPDKPKPGELAPPLVESNLSATAFAMDALAHIGEHEAACKAAVHFARTMQNDDGGFHFIYDDPVRNKGGGPDDGTFHSYGTTTADGIRILVHCGESAERARAWLVKHFDAANHPGTFTERHEPSRNGLYYYWAASVARTFVLTGEGPANWREELIKALLERQREDGSWRNEIPTMREDDATVATAFAVYALTLASTD